MSPDPAANLWSAALGRLQLQTPRPTFDTWLMGTKGVRLDGDELTVSLTSAFAVDWVEQHLQTLVDAAVRAVAGRPLQVRYLIGSADLALPAPAADEDEPAERPARPRSRGAKSAFSPEYTFASFVQGDSNQLAYAAAQAVAEKRGPQYNPLFLYGPVGTGKTHLLHAIGRQAEASGLSALYVTAEEFTNEFTGALRSNRHDAFRERFRGVDILLVDDVQFLAGKTATQGAFYETFNALIRSGGQLVLSSDRPGGDLRELSARLRSRFQGGLQADLGLPGYETRLALLSAFAERVGVAIPQEGLAFIAERVTESARPLLGCVTRLAAIAEFTRLPITLHLIRETLGTQASAPENEVTPPAVIRTVALARGVPPASITGRGRDRATSSARQLAMYLLHTELGISPEEIGAIMGNRDRTTVLYGLQRAGEAIAAKAALAEEVENLRVSLQSGTASRRVSTSA